MRDLLRICSFWHSRDLSPVLVLSLAALGTTYLASTAQGWQGAGLGGKYGSPKAWQDG